jgi:hypothetical protein
VNPGGKRPPSTDANRALSLTDPKPCAVTLRRLAVFLRTKPDIRPAFFVFELVGAEPALSDLRPPSRSNMERGSNSKVGHRGGVPYVDRKVTIGYYPAI